MRSNSRPPASTTHTVSFDASLVHVHSNQPQWPNPAHLHPPPTPRPQSSGSFAQPTNLICPTWLKVSLACVHHPHHILNGQARLCNIGGQHHLAHAAGRHPERLALLAAGTGRARHSRVPGGIAKRQPSPHEKSDSGLLQHKRWAAGRNAQQQPGSSCRQIGNTQNNTSSSPLHLGDTVECRGTTHCALARKRREPSSRSCSS